MKNYNEVKNQDDKEKLLNSIAGFHDSMTKEFHIMNSAYIDHDIWMPGKMIQITFSVIALDADK